MVEAGKFEESLSHLQSDSTTGEARRSKFRRQVKHSLYLIDLEVGCIYMEKVVRKFGLEIPGAH